MKHSKHYNKSNSYVAIMAGGIGSRFWPISRSNYPKQFLDILNTGETLIQATLRRFNAFIPLENIYVITADDYLTIVEDQLPELPKENILGEPERKNTAACIAYVSTKLQAINPEANLIIAPSDHLIGDDELFRKHCETGLHFTSKYDVFLTLGIQPTHPNTGYGYIHYGHEMVGDEEVHEVYQFTEKPNKETAELFLEAGNFLWNSGIFIWKASVLLKALEEFQPAMFKLFSKAARQLNTSNEVEAIKQVYQKCAAISIDYAVMEHAQNVYVIPSSFKWNDLGTWSSAYENFNKDAMNNAVNNFNTITKDTSGCMIHSNDKKLMVVGGVKDLIIVNTPDAILVCSKDKEQEIKDYVSLVKEVKGNTYL
ncbi:mannose-1-phosphate guanylyltransferase [Echinicola sp. CAU 1574]|uniref:Mannose-1-phosphate guanylyltransferase n=1 Tax=Echinicola arenosa TaxID=2774144 RepID=A0ABR9AKX3_9BACT|nr:mannose-1-phosphate guanylyltransferase [Echinicola arenosa]MBD8488976.1 mannose-1-phosphate guanylyltransferase [Echinicola arenosa]